jgi:hypothetical protein
MIGMAKSHHAINPLLIAALTGQAITEIPPSPALSLLPGRLTKSNIEYKNRIDPPAVSHHENLICGHCGHQGKYDLGLIAFNMERWEKEKGSASENELNF